MLDLSTARFAFLGFGNMAMAMADGTVIDVLGVDRNPCEVEDD